MFSSGLFTTEARSNAAPDTRNPGAAMNREAREQTRNARQESWRRKTRKNTEKEKDAGRAVRRFDSSRERITRQRRGKQEGKRRARRISAGRDLRGTQ